MSGKTLLAGTLAAWLVLMQFSCAKPVAGFSHSGERERLILPVQVKFENTSRNAETYEWEFGDGERSTEPSPEHEYKSSGNYAVRLKAVKGSKESVSEQRIQVLAPEACLVEIETDYGTMVAVLNNGTPRHRDNFYRLAEEGYYDGQLFHRLIEGFMMQGGDPSSRKAKPGQSLGSGGPGYTLPAEITDSLVHVKGALAAARQGDAVNPEKRSSGSQFYIVQGRPLSREDLAAAEASKGIRYTQSQRESYLASGGAPQLDGEYTIFGQVISGIEVIDRIAAEATDEQSRPLRDIRMKIRVLK
jgi:peptidyl-prolyl cis-trans isomerase B (cyclophilin B)